MRGLALAAPVALAALLTTAPAQASVFDIYGFDPRGMALGNAQVAGTNSYAATYYNPGAMTAVKQVSFGAGLTLVMPSLTIERADLETEFGEILPEPHVGLTLGWLYPLGGVFDDKVAIGLSLYLPMLRFARIQGFDPQVPQYYLFQNLQDKLLVNLAVAWEPFEWLSVGAGLQILADVAASANLHLNILNEAFDHTDIGVEILPSLSPSAGLHLRPTEGLSFGVAWRAPTSLRFDLPVMVKEGDLLALDLLVSQQVLWSPHQVTVGGAWDLPWAPLSLSVDATWAAWSGAPDPSPQLAVDIGGPLLEATGLADALDLAVRNEPLELGFVDTVTARFGVELSPLDWLRVRAGYFFRPTPAPRQTGVTSYLDNDAHVVSLGLGFVVDDPLEVHPNPVEIDVAAQMGSLPTRAVRRTDAGHPVGDLSHGGTVYAFSIAVGHRY